ncbi:MAG TPA: glycosyltransferase family 2 protein [Baekduia sp.]|uniref:glycosyltransferase family 2 protein n=1 Tax=Baekduia sp. TaxID=2600305 RepID=UPI002D770D6A|nr:glycosyltransferase family 2 protein [Baekduia sp.]HET6508246.1 glycosyltransferase family 2 protein [Baekduia sp.]
MADLAIIVVSHNSRSWLGPCLSSLAAHADGLQLDVVVVDNGSTDGSAEYVAEHHPEVRVLRRANRGFAYGNNEGLRTVDAPYALLLNPDTELLDGRLADVIAVLEAQPDVGVAGVRQVTADGTLWPTIRYFPTPLRAACQALGSERWPARRRWMGERELDLDSYTRQTDCDWTSGSFLLARREALLAAGLLDERFFLFSEETDLCLRIRQAGWRVVHVPDMTILHHAGKAGVSARLVAQDAFTRRQYARKHFTPPRRALYLSALGTGHLLRAVAPGSGGGERRDAARLALATLWGRTPPPFVAPPPTAVHVHPPDRA